MKRNVSSLLVGYGGLAAVLGLLTQQFAADLARPAMFAGIFGGGLSALWVLLGLVGKPHRGWALLTMAAVGLVLLSQGVAHWIPSGEAKPGTRALALLVTIMFLATFVTLTAVAHAGIPAQVAGDRRSGDGGNSSGRNPSGSGTPDAWKEARRQGSPGLAAKP